MRDVDLAPETLAVGIERAIARTLDSGARYVTFPGSHSAAIIQALNEMDPPPSDGRKFCCLTKTNAYVDLRGRITLCLEDADTPHTCQTDRLQRRTYRDDTAKGFHSPITMAVL